VNAARGGRAVTFAPMAGKVSESQLVFPLHDVPIDVTKELPGLIPVNGTMGALCAFQQIDATIGTNLGIFILANLAFQTSSLHYPKAINALRKTQQDVIVHLVWMVAGTEGLSRMHQRNRSVLEIVCK